MAFDSVFNGDPTTPNVTSSGKATFGIYLSSGQLYFKDDSVAGWQKTAGGGGDSGSVVTSHLTLTNTDMAGWNDTPFQLLPALPGNQFYDVISASFIINVVTPLDSGPDNGLQLTTLGQSSSGGNLIIMDVGFLSSTSSSYIDLSVTGSPTLLSAMLGSPLVVFGNDMTGGDGSTLDIFVNYIVRTLP